MKAGEKMKLLVHGSWATPFLGTTRLLAAGETAHRN